MLESYVGGRWLRSPAEGKPALDATTGEVVAFIPTEPVRASEALTFARTVGGPALRELTFHDRSALLKAVGLVLLANKDALYQMSYATGATTKDSWVDIDGGAGTLLSFSSIGRRELPASRVAVDGRVEQLGKKGTFVGQHVMTSKRGAAIQINAFNFPVWGMLEKFAPAFLAGMPSVVKPASQTAYLTEQAVRCIIETGILPEGSLQLLIGGSAGLLDGIEEQDVVGFTGSASTARLLRAHPAVIEHNVPLTTEADSLNFAALGPDSSAETPEFDLFVREVVREMTAKAGQKCTAIRRCFVPRAVLDDVEAAVRAELDAVVMADPRDPETQMGPLVSVAQREDVKDAARRIAGDSSAVAFNDAGARRGAFLRPVLIQVSPSNSAVHEVEAFGPVSAILGYSSPTEVAELVARGRGSLVGSIVSHDKVFVADLVSSVAAFHGRLHVLDRDSAGESTGHGSPLPMLVHGGPGRAGGGEELGGIRAVFHHMQRTAVQGSPDMLTAVTGEFVRGSSRTETSVHPFRKSFHELSIGDAVSTGSRAITLTDIEQFAALTGDTFYAHTDEVAAAANPLFGGIVAHGYLVLSYAAGLFVDPAPGPVLANTGLDRLRFTKPVKPGDQIRVVLTCAVKTPKGPEQGEVRWDATVYDQDDEVVASYELLTMVAV